MIYRPRRGQDLSDGPGLEPTEPAGPGLVTAASALAEQPNRHGLPLEQQRTHFAKPVLISLPTPAH